jgi:hypothetical protein
MSTSTEATQSLNFALKRVEDEFKDVPEGQDMIEKVTAKFVQSCNAPPRQEFEFILSKAFTDDEVIVCLFQPRLSQIGYYPTLLAAAHAAPMGHPLTKLCPLLISLLFLVHRYTILVYTDYCLIVF